MSRNYMKRCACGSILLPSGICRYGCEKFRKLKQHLDHVGVPLCCAKAAGALLVDERRNVTSEACKRAHARRLAEAAKVVLQ